MRFVLISVLACVVAAPAVSADYFTVFGEAAGVPYSVGPVPTVTDVCTNYFWYETTDFGVFYSNGKFNKGGCAIFIRAL